MAELEHSKSNLVFKMRHNLFQNILLALKHQLFKTRILGRFLLSSLRARLRSNDVPPAILGIITNMQPVGESWLYVQHMMKKCVKD